MFVKVAGYKVLTHSQESADGVIVHNIFDVLTLERMLQYMYEGDYTVKAVTLEVGKENDCNEPTGCDVDDRKCLPPHLRNVSAAATSCEERQIIVQTKALAPNAKTAHVLVYAIAEYYELPELRSLAAEKFKTTNEALGIGDFLQLAKAIYWNTKTADDDLRKELLLMLMTNHSEWLVAEQFMGALASDIELHEFTVTIMSAMSTQLIQKYAQNQATTEAQAKATILLSDLDQANEDLARSSQCNRALEGQVAQLEADVQSSKSEISRLEEELKVFSDWGHKHSEQADEHRKQMNEAREKLKGETARANKYLDFCHQKDETIKHKDAKVQAETTRANQNRELCNRKDETINQQDIKIQTATERANKNFDICKQLRTKIETETNRANSNYDLCNQRDETTRQNNLTIEAERLRAERAMSIIKSIVSNVNCCAECSSCGEELNFKLQKDDRTGGYPFNAMLRCLQCNWKQYGDQVD